MRRKLWIGFGGAALVAAGAVALWRPWQAKDDGLAELAWGQVTRGDIEVVVSSTGTLEAIDSVEVGTQVSGTLAEVRVDFNDRVRAGEVLARIDPKLLDAALREVEAGLSRTRAQLAQAEADVARQRALLAEQLVPESEFATYATAVATARASVEATEAQVERARENRANAIITSPIDGVVIERAVEAGQTVAASFSTPRLFLLARDLAKMRILAEVDEGDIGQIRVGQTVRFTVAAHPERELGGTVDQIRLQPTVAQNVVKYTVVVDAPNDEGLLLPGMTATVDFVIETVRDVLTVPAAAARLQPSEAMLAALAARRGGSESAAGGAEEPPAGTRRIWFRDAQGRLDALPVRLGLSDGRRVEIRPPAGELAPGTAVVIRTGAAEAATPRGGATGGRPTGFRVL
jgi:HlyD family secretion protein